MPEVHCDCARCLWQLVAERRGNWEANKRCEKSVVKPMQAVIGGASERNLTLTRTTLFPAQAPSTPIRA